MVLNGLYTTLLLNFTNKRAICAVSNRNVVLKKTLVVSGKNKKSFQTQNSKTKQFSCDTMQKCESWVPSKSFSRIKENVNFGNCLCFAPIWPWFVLYLVVLWTVVRFSHVLTGQATSASARTPRESLWKYHILLKCTFWKLRNNAKWNRALC